MLSNIGSFVKSLLPSFERSRIDDDLRNLKKEIEDETLPPLRTSVEHFRISGFRSNLNIEYDKLFVREVNTRAIRREMHLAMIVTALDRCLQTTEMLMGQVDSLFGDEVAAQNMTYTRANVLRLIETMTFFVSYARKHMLWIHHNESEALGRGFECPLAPADMAWLVDNRRNFFHAFNTVAKRTGDTRSALANIPDMVVVPDEVDAVTESVGRDRIDPLQMNFISATFHPAYRFRKMLAERRAARYEAAVQERKSLEYRMIVLRDYLNKEPNARTEEELELVEARAKKLNARAAKLAGMTK